MYFYLLMAAAVAFGTWLLGPYRTRAYFARWQQKPAPLMPQDKAALRKYFGKLFAVVTVLLGVGIGTISYSESKTKTGIAAYDQGRYAASETDLRRAISFDPSSATSHYYLGLCLRQEGETEEARQEFKTACRNIRGQRSRNSTDDQMEQDAEAQLQQLGSKP